MARLRINRENRRDFMLTSPMHKLIPAMALPTVMSSVINSIYNLADTYFVSGLGTYATSAVGINASLDSLISIAGSFFAMGAGSFISRLLGAKNEEKTEQVFITTLFSGLLFGTIVLIVGKVNMVPLVRFLGAIPEIEQYAIDYADYVLYAAPFMVTQLILNHSLRAEGSATFALVGITFGGILNCGLDPLFIYTLGMGVKGASLATALSKLASFAILLSPYAGNRTLVKLNLKSISYTWDVISEVAKMGSPGLFRSGLQVATGIVMNRIAGAQFSAATLAAISVTNRLLMMLRAGCLGYSHGFQPVAGFCWGAKRYDRVKEAYNFSSVTIMAFISLPCAIMFIFSPRLISAFTTADAEMLRIGTLALRTQCAVLPLDAWTMIVNGLYSATGRASGALLISITRQGLCFFPLIYTLPRFFGINGLIAVQPGAEILTLVIVAPLALNMMRLLRRLQTENQDSLVADLMSDEQSDEFFEG